MQTLQSTVMQLKRPGLLVRAARFGIDHYRRTRDLARLLPDMSPAGPAPTLMALLDAEHAVNAMRLEQDRAYDIVQHIDLLTAIMAESRDLDAVTRPRPGL